jgi:hypothetical protein
VIGSLPEGNTNLWVLPIVLTVLAGAALGGGIAAGLTVIVIAAVVALVVLGAVNCVRSLDRLSHTLYD